MSLKYRIYIFVCHQREIKFILLVLFEIFLSNCLVLLGYLPVGSSGYDEKKTVFNTDLKKYEDLHSISIQCFGIILHTTLKKYFDPVFGIILQTLE